MKKTRKNRTRRQRVMKGGSQELLDAVNANNLLKAKELLKAGDDVNTATNNGSTILYVASSKGYLKMVQLLFKYGADVNMANNEGDAPLYTASWGGHVDVVFFLLEKGANVNRANNNGLTPLYAASHNEQLATMELLLKNGADINKANKYGLTPLILASDRGNIKAVELLLKKGADINKESDKGNTAFHSATNNACFGNSENAFDRSLKVMELLLKKGFNINKENSRGTTPFYLATANACVSSSSNFIRNLKVMEFLLEKGADINRADNGLTPFHSATFHACESIMNSDFDRNLKVMKFLLDKGADINKENNDGHPPLLSAYIYRRIDVAEFLIKNKADINKVDKKGNTILIICYEDDNKNAVKHLIDNGADINKANNNGHTILYIAMSDVNVQFSKFLLEKGAIVTDAIKKDIDTFDPDIQALLGYTAKESNHLWKGWTRADSEALDTIFDSENANEYSHCPFCLKYSNRIDGCMYMWHNCRKGGGYYHKKLYNFFKNSQGFVGWCTICGRPCIGHHHCVLSRPDNPSKELMKDENGMIIQGSPFDTDCRRDNGGGGIPEKLARFRRLREFAKALEKEKAGTITETEAMNALVEEAWKAPLTRNPNIGVILNTKTWNFPHSNFKTRINGNNNTRNAPNILRPEPNASDPNLQPIRYESGTNTLYGDEGVKVVQFRHRQEDGSINNHENDRIALDNLEEWLKNATKNFGEDSFGYCYMYPACKAKLYPSELIGLVPEELLEDYRKKFNKKFRVASGGGTNNIFVEAKDAVCVIPPKKGGRKTRRRRKVFRK